MEPAVRRRGGGKRADGGQRVFCGGRGLGIQVEGDGFGGGVGVELAEDVPHMGADGGFINAQFRGDGLLGKSAGHAGQNLALAVSEGLNDRPASTEVVNNGLGDGAGNYGAAMMHRPDGLDQLVGGAGFGQISTGSGFEGLDQETRVDFGDQEDGGCSGPERPDAPDDLGAGHVAQEEADEEQAGVGLGLGKGPERIPAGGADAAGAQTGSTANDCRHELPALIVALDNANLDGIQRSSWHKIRRLLRNGHKPCN